MGLSTENFHGTPNARIKTPKTPSLFLRSFPLLAYNLLVGLFVAAEYINLITISNLLWPGEPFHSFDLGVMVSLRLWIDGLCALFFGYLVDRYDRKKIFAFNSLATGSLIILNSTLPVGGGYSDFTKWVIVRAFIGMTMSGGGPNMNSIGADLFGKKERSRYFGFVNIGWAVAETVGMIISAFLFDLGYWRYYYLTIGIIFVCHGGYIALSFHIPKRGLQEKELHGILSGTDISYEYKITKQTLKDTIFSKSNLLIFAEGIFTNIFFGIMNLVILPYIQSSPRNISPGNTALFILIFGVPGALFGTLYFAKISDKYGEKNLKNRITFIIISIAFSFVSIILLFIIPLPHLSPAEGTRIGILFDYPIFFLMGFVLFFSRIVISIFRINQQPLIQEINLPEAQGTIRSWNQLVEVASYGSGPIIAGWLLEQTNNNYLGSMLQSIWIVIPGILLWFLVYKTVEKDRKKISRILSERALELEEKHKNSEV